MKLILIFLLQFLAESSTQEVSCQYFNFPFGYTCYLNIFNPLGGEFDEILGEHLQGFGNENVTRLEAWDGSTPNIPEVGST